MHAGSQKVLSTSRDDTLAVWDGKKGLAPVVSCRHNNNTGAPTVLPEPAERCSCGSKYNQSHQLSAAERPTCMVQHQSTQPCRS